MSGPVFVQRGNSFQPTEKAVGPWNPEQLHGGAPAALIARAFDRLEPMVPMTWARLSIDILRPVPRAELQLDARVARPGKRVQLLEATLSASGVEVARATGLRIRRAAIALPERGELPPPLPAPGDSRESRTLRWVGFGSVMDVRVARGSILERGPAAVWFRLNSPIVDDEPPTPLMRVAAAADFGNGISAELDFATHLFINPDAVIHLFREPDGEWVGVDAATRFGPDGTALAETTLHDERGPIGRSSQSLLVGLRNDGVSM